MVPGRPPRRPRSALHRPPGSRETLLFLSACRTSCAAPKCELKHTAHNRTDCVCNLEPTGSGDTGEVLVFGGDGSGDSHAKPAICSEREPGHEARDPTTHHPHDDASGR